MKLNWIKLNDTNKYLSQGERHSSKITKTIFPKEYKLEFGSIELFFRKLESAKLTAQMFKDDRNWS